MENSAKSRAGALLITGSGGFIGSNVAEYFGARGAVCLTPRSFELDLTDSLAVKKYFGENEIGAIIHCSTVGGARGVQDPSDTVEKNLAMFRNLKTVSRGEIPLITFGSGAQYDKARALKKVSESELGRSVPKNLYGLSKMKIAEEVERTENVICLNIFGCFGKNEKASRFPAYAILQCLSGKNITVNCDCVFDYLWIGDLCRALDKILERGARERVMNLTPTESVSLSGFAKLAREVLCAKSEIFVSDSSSGLEYTGDNSRFLRNFPDFTFTPLRASIAEYSAHLKKILSDKTR